MMIQAPYRFVPLSDIVVFPEWGNLVSHDKPFEDGLCGELDISIKTHGKVCVGGEQIPASNNQAGQVKFYRTPEGELAIPGSSLKGMLRNVLEIATFSRFKQVEDQKLGVRDISEANNFYSTSINVKNVKAGWLNFKNGQWILYPCRLARLHQKDLIQACNINYEDWATNEMKTICNRYSLIGFFPEICFTIDRTNSIGQSIGIPVTENNNETYRGNIVVTGQPGTFYDKDNPSQPKGAKKYEFIFYNTSEEFIPISHEVMSAFKQIHEDIENKNEWAFWKKNLPNLTYGVPIFYHENNNQVISMGLAMMYKLAYKNSIHQAIKHTSPEHIESTQLDFSDLIFGCLDNQALKGRVNIGLAEIQQDNINHKFSYETVVLSTPKPTYYPLYIYQDNEKEFNQLMKPQQKLSGWKRYPIKNIVPPCKTSNVNIQVCLECVDEGVEFRGKIYFHNLRAVELGALLWVLDFGGRTELRHGLGIGKPYGLGKVSLSVISSKLRRNDSQKIQDERIMLRACCLEFIHFMESIFDKNEFIKDKNNKCKWADSNEIKALLEYAQEHEDAENLGYLDSPNKYAKLRKVSNLSDFIKTFHSFSSTLRLIKSSELIVDYSNQLEQMLELAQKEQEKAEAKTKLQKMIEEAGSDEDRALLELKEIVRRLQQEGVSKTLKNKASKKFNESFEKLESFSDEQKNELKQLIQQTNELIDDNRVKKLCKKVNLEN